MKIKRPNIRIEDIRKHQLVDSGFSYRGGGPCRRPILFWIAPDNGTERGARFQNKTAAGSHRQIRTKAQSEPKHPGGPRKAGR